MQPADVYPPVSPNCMRCVMVGDIVGKPGMHIAELAAPWLRQRMKADFLVANGENAADGTGLRVREFERLIRAGYDVITLGDHVFKKKEIMTTLGESDRLVRPLNFPSQASGKGFTTVTARNGVEVSVISLMGRVFMRPVDCPFAAIDRLLKSEEKLGVIKLVDLHAEATSDKQSMGWYVDGRVSGLFGTHTHVATADEYIMEKGTAYQTDVGMTGPFRSILGRSVEAVLEATVSFEPTAFHVATDDVRITGCYGDFDTDTGVCVAIARFQWKLELLATWESHAKQLAKNL